jgi:hypothetical protein
MPHWDLPRLSAFVIEAKAVLVASIVKIFTLEFGDRTNSSSGVD